MMVVAGMILALLTPVEIGVEVTDVCRDSDINAPLPAV